MSSPPTPTQVAIGAVRRIRAERGWSAQRLADRCAELGAPGLNKGVLANFESGRRDALSVDELFALALALDVAPVHLLVPLDNDNGMTVVGDRVEHAGHVRAWVRGVRPLDGTDAGRYADHSPAGEYRRTTDYDQRLAVATRARSRAFGEAMRAQAAFDAAVVAMEHANLTGDEELIEAAKAEHHAALVDRARWNARAQLYGRHVDEIEAELDEVDRGYVDDFDPFELADNNDNEGEL